MRGGVERVVLPQGIVGLGGEQRVEPTHLGENVLAKSDPGGLLCVFERLHGVGKIERQLVGDYGSVQFAPLVGGFETQIPEGFAQKAKRRRHHRMMPLR